MVGMKAAGLDCERDPQSTQGRTKPSTHCLGEFRDGRTPSTSVHFMTNIAASSSSASASQLATNVAVVS